MTPPTGVQVASGAPSVGAGRDLACPFPIPLARMIGWFVPVGERASWARTLAEIHRLSERR